MRRGLQSRRRKVRRAAPAGPTMAIRTRQAAGATAAQGPRQCWACRASAADSERLQQRDAGADRAAEHLERATRGEARFAPPPVVAEQRCAGRVELALIAH